MSAVTVELPEKLHAKAREVASAKNLSLDALITLALTQSLSRLVRDEYLEERAAGATGKGLAEFLAQVPATPPAESDQLPEGYAPKPRRR
jgi:hypothetical protein